MLKRDRMAAALAGAPVDRVPVSAWAHFFLDEMEPVRFADRMTSFQQAFDWDFLKIHARASYHVEPFGFEYAPAQSMEKGHTLTHTPIRQAEDWLKLRPVPTSAPALEEQLTALARMRSQLPDDIPIIMTVFTPLDIAEKLLDRNTAQMAEHIETAPEAVQHALSVFAETMHHFMEKVVALGVDGVFFSTKWINENRLSPAEYRALCAEHDKHMMSPAAALPFNILHVCENDVHLDAFADYPVSVLHWNNRGRNNPSLSEGRKLTGKGVSGGVNPALLEKGSPADIEAEAVQSIVDCGGTGMFLSPGCSFRIALTPEENLKALRAAPEKAARLLETTSAV